MVASGKGEGSKDSEVLLKRTLNNPAISGYILQNKKLYKAEAGNSKMIEEPRMSSYL